MGLMKMAQHRQAPSHFKEEPGHDSVSATFFNLCSPIHPPPRVPHARLPAVR